MLSRLKSYLKSSFLSLPLSVVVCFSPLPPLTTLLFLSKLGVWELLPKEVVEPEELRRLGYASEFVRLYEEVLKAQRTGRREALKDYLKEVEKAGRLVKVDSWRELLRALKEAEQEIRNT